MTNRTWRPDGGLERFVQAGPVWTHSARMVPDGFEFIATEHRGTDYYVPVPVHIVRALLKAWDQQHARARGHDVVATTTLWRPVGRAELDKIAELGWAAFPPRLPEQPIFYPICNEEYACQIAQRWNAKDGETGYVVCFEVDEAFLRPYPTHIVGSRIHEEYWIPAADLEAFNAAIVGPILVSREFPGIKTEP